MIGLKSLTNNYQSYTKGKDKKAILNIEEINLKLLATICYEIIYSGALNNNSDYDLIINISEDGWFGNSIGPYQHFSKGIFRAIEQNTFLLRSTNKGISAIVNNKGQIIKKLDPSESANIQSEIPLIKTDVKNKNDLIFFILLFTYISIFKFYEKNNVKK